MSVRLVEILVPDDSRAALESLIRKHCRRYWEVEVPGSFGQFSCLVQSRYVERFLAQLDREFGHVPEFQAVVLGTEALLPPIEERRETALPEQADIPPPSRIEAFFSRDRISTDELYDDIAENIGIRPAFLVTVILSAIIAALGMRSGNTAVVIGAMVIAPLLGPSMGMALSATVGDAQLAWRSTSTLIVGSIAAVIATWMAGLMIEIDAAEKELLLRASVKPSDVALALASGAAGVLAFSRGRALSLVGVMIAVALVPPLAAIGLFLAAQRYDLAGGALFLFATNLVCVNLAGIVTFLLQGLPPKNWRITGGIMATWLFVLILFVMAMVGRAAFGLSAPPVPYWNSSSPFLQAAVAAVQHFG